MGDTPNSPFDSRDYVVAALHGNSDDWRTHAARGILELRGDSALHLAGFEGADVAFYRAVLHWLDGFDAAAAGILAGLELPQARALLTLISKPRIRVLCQMIADSPTPFAFPRGALLDPKFEITNVDFLGQWEGSLTSIDVRDHVDAKAPPDFYVASMIEWSPLLDNLTLLGCPVLGHVLDPDLACQTNRPLYAMFDELIVNGAAEKTVVEAQSSRLATVYPHCFAVDEADLPPCDTLDAVSRDIDVLMTGTTIDPYHPDKRSFLRHVFQIEGCEPLVVQGFLPRRAYFRTYARARAVMSFMRYNARGSGQGAETRIIEALALGCPVLSLPGTDLHLFLGEGDGLHTFDASFQSLEGLLQAFRRNEGVSGDVRAQRAEKIRTMFGHRKIGSRYLRFLTFRAAMIDVGARSPAPATVLHQRVTGWRNFPIPNGQLLARMVSTIRGRKNGSEMPHNLMVARELVLSVAEKTRRSAHGEADTEKLQKALDFLSEISESNRRALAVRFMQIRAGLHLGNASQRQSALALLSEALALPIEHWSVGPEDHVMPYDFFPQMFDYRSYFDSLVHGGDEATEAKRRVAMILASLHAYHGWYANDYRSFQMAKVLNSDFINYRLWAARAVLCSGADMTEVERTDVRSDLEMAARDPMTAQQATHLLSRFKAELYGPGMSAETLLVAADKAERCIVYVAQPEGDPGSALEKAWRLPDNRFNVESVERRSDPPPAEDCLVTVVVCPRPRRDYAPLLQSLAGQRMLGTVFQGIWADPYGILPASLPDFVDTIISCGQDGAFEHLNRCYNRALLAARGSIIVICDQDRALPSEFLATVVRAFAQRSDQPMVLTTTKGTTRAAMIEGMLDDIDMTIAFRLADLIGVGGFDEAPFYFARLSGPFDAAVRLARGACHVATIDCGPSARDARCHQAFIREYLRQSYAEGRLLPHVENPGVRALRRGYG